MSDTHLKVEKRRKETDKSKRSFSTCISNSNVDIKAVKKHPGKGGVCNGFKRSVSITDRHGIQEMYRCSFGIAIICRVSMKIFNNRGVGINNKQSSSAGIIEAMFLETRTSM